MTNSQDILFSIIMPTYNRAHMIGKAIESVLSQTYTNWELIIIDDGSTDNTRETISKYQDKRIKYYYQKNNGRSAARNKGIELSKGAYISFLDDDDYYLPEFLEEFRNKIVVNLNKNTLFMCYQFEEINNKLNIIKVDKKKIYKNHVKYLIAYSNNLQPFIIPTGFFKKEKFDERFEIGEDFHLLIRLLFNSNFILIEKPLCVYNNHENMTMVKEFTNSLFMNMTYNRLDVLNDIFSNYKKLLTEHNYLKDVLNKYNKIAYFYASTALRKKKIRYALKLMRYIKWGGTLSRVVYYKTSIFIRMFYYYFK
ncbi:MAG TPA: glycosyltransferase [Bacteroidetes bacterium]|nr:glycosyltransferase [Bacteroidota bacterium]